MNSEEKNYSTEKRIVGNMKMAKKAMDRLEFTKLIIRKHITQRLTPEQMVAVLLKEEGITEEEFFKMKDHLSISGPLRVTIANHLRDLWRKEVNDIFGKETR